MHINYSSYYFVPYKSVKVGELLLIGREILVCFHLAIMKWIRAIKVYLISSTLHQKREVISVELEVARIKKYI